MNRAERRRLARRVARAGAGQMEEAAERGEVPIAFFTDTGHYELGESKAELPDRIVGHHRWIANAAYVLTDDQVMNEAAVAAGESDLKTMLDSSTRFVFGICCYDCEGAFPVIKPGSFCPGDPNDHE